ELEDISLYSNFFNTGRANSYNQNLTASYKIPINKLPYLDFINSNYSYSGNFSWQAASPSFVNEIGNTIQNGNSHNVTANLNFSKFYNKIGLKKLFNPKKKKKTASLPSVGKSKKKKGNTVGDFAYNLLSSLKSAKFSYNKKRGTSLNGYVPEIGFLGRDKYNGGHAPTLGFVFGDQSNILNKAIENEWLVSRSATDVAYSKNYSQNEFTNMDYNITVKPIRDLNIQFTGNRSYSENTISQIDVVDNVLQNNSVNQSGNFNISYSLIKTAYSSNPDELFNTFVDNRAIVLNELHPDNQTTIANAVAGGANESQVTSQGLNSQEVLIHSFLAAYSGNDAKGGDKKIFKSIPIPNWQLTYRGLMKLDYFKKRFSNFTLTHGYNSSYTINNFSNNLNSDTSNPFQSNLIYSGITLVDNFSPLIKLDMKFKSSFSIRGTVNRNRALSLNLNNTTLSEVSGNEYVFGIGYRFRDIKIKTKFLGKRKTLTGDINVKADVSYRTDETNIRSVDTNSSQVTGGQNLLGIKLAADYNLSRSFTATLYYDQNVASYAISTLYPRQSINAGLSIVYNLGN
ncbi:cell surface protein SprA, partial [Flavobacteriaceae bacterium]|nr:cell surface protein SprA [Flavobacteriaceae bacterium]